MFITVHRDVKVYQLVWKLTALRNILLAHMDTHTSAVLVLIVYVTLQSMCRSIKWSAFNNDCVCNYLLVHVCYTARSKYPTLLRRSLLFVEICYCLVEVCYIALSNYVTLLGPSMLHCSVQVCYIARSKYATVLGPSRLHSSAQVYATLLSPSTLQCSHASQV
jgi:hypothetical protein